MTDDSAAPGLPPGPPLNRPAPTPGRWARVKELFHAALERPSADRPAFLAEACAAEPELLAEVLSLLESHDASHDFLGVSAVEVVGQATEEDPAGQRIGPWRLVEPLGRGGMGAVYLAERDDGIYRRKVAIKLLHRGMDTDSILRRFHQERRILAELDHPHIARLIDAGATDDGRPYFVLEHVEGERIDLFCQSRDLPVERRLELFMDVCDAVEYAHRRLIVHRDLKPGNILVTPDGVPKLLDFGIAKVLSAEADPEATEPGRGQPLTPGYASPEQLQGLPITVSTDVYSLGVLLYVLLTDRRPFADTDGGDGAPRAADEEPPRPSSVVTDARRRARLRGDLDTIVAASVRARPERRYATVERLGADVRRHLESRPVHARRDSVRYRAGRFVHRHRVSVAVAAVLAATLLAGVGATVWQMRVAESERALAERRFDDVRRLARLFIFHYADAIEALPGSTPVRERMVRDAFAYLDQLARESAGDRSLQLELAHGYEKVGEVQVRLGDIGGSLESHRRSLELYRSVLAAGPGDVDVQRAMAHNQLYLADRLTDTGDARGALAEHLQVLALREDILRARPDDPEALRDVWDSQLFVGRALLATGRFQEGLRRLQEAALVSQQTLLRDSTSVALRSDALTSEHTLAMGLATVGDDEGALAGYRRALELARGLVAEDPISAAHRQALSRTERRVGRTLHALGEPLAALVHLAEARRVSEALAAEDRSNQETVYDLVQIHAALGDVLRTLGRRDDAAGEYARSRELGEAALRRDPDHARFRDAVAGVYRATGEFLVERRDTAEGVRWLARSVALYDGLARQDPQNADVLKDRALSRERLAAALEKRAADAPDAADPTGGRGVACQEYERSVDEWRSLERAALLAPRYADRPAAVQRALERCRNGLS